MSSVWWTTVDLLPYFVHLPTYCTVSREGGTRMLTLGHCLCGQRSILKRSTSPTEVIGSMQLCGIDARSSHSPILVESDYYCRAVHRSVITGHFRSPLFYATINASQERQAACSRCVPCIRIPIYSSRRRTHLDAFLPLAVPSHSPGYSGSRQAT